MLRKIYFQTLILLERGLSSTKISSCNVLITNLRLAWNMDEVRALLLISVCLALVLVDCLVCHLGQKHCQRGCLIWHINKSGGPWVLVQREKIAAITWHYWRVSWNAFSGGCFYLKKDDYFSCDRNCVTRGLLVWLTKFQPLMCQAKRICSSSAG